MSSLHVCRPNYLLVSVFFTMEQHTFERVFNWPKGRAEESYFIGLYRCMPICLLFLFTLNFFIWQSKKYPIKPEYVSAHKFINSQQDFSLSSDSVRMSLWLCSWIHFLKSLARGGIKSHFRSSGCYQVLSREIFKANGSVCAGVWQQITQGTEAMHL